MMSNNSELERRRAQRYPIAIAGTLRASGGRRVSIELHDISALGFNCEYASDLAVGEHLWAKFANLESIDVTVVWRERYRYGLLFNIPLNEAVLDHIVRQYGKIAA